MNLLFATNVGSSRLFVVVLNRRGEKVTDIRFIDSRSKMFGS